MRRADRLFQLVHLIRRDRVTTAAALASELGVSERTVYRDVADLVRSGVPITGEAGVGYALPRHFELPPLMFTETEATALALGARIVASWGDPELTDAARRALTRIQVVVPERLRERISKVPLFAPDFHVPDRAVAPLGLLRAAIESRHRVSLAYTRPAGPREERTVRPLALFFWGSSWSLAAWCELRTAFRNFRLDRMDVLAVLDAPFPEEPGRELADYVRTTSEDSPRPPWFSV